MQLEARTRRHTAIMQGLLRPEAPAVKTGIEMLIATVTEGSGHRGCQPRPQHCAPSAPPASRQSLQGGAHSTPKEK